MRQLGSTCAGFILLASTSLTPVYAHAQSQASAEVANAQADTATGLNEIIVTARKSEESLIGVPVAVTALDAAALENRGIQDLYDVASFTPGFSDQRQSVGRNDRGFNQYVMRGIVPGSALPNRQSVTIFVDGAPITGGSVSGVSDIARIEVVKGPQSAFFGKSTFAGAVNIITRAPSYEFGGSVQASYERFNTYELQGSIEGAIIPDLLAFRLSARAEHTDGQYQDVVFTDKRLGERDTKSISLSLLAEPADNLSIRLFGVRWNDSDGLPANARFGAPQRNCNSGVAPQGTNNYFCGALNNVPTEFRTWDQRLIPAAIDVINAGTAPLIGANFIDHLGLERKATQLRATAEWTLGDYTVSAVGAYGLNKWAFLQTNFGQDITNIPNISFIPNSGRLAEAYQLIYGQVQDKDYYAELRVASPQENRLKWLIGLNYLEASTALTTSSYTNVGFARNTAVSEFASKAHAIFGSLGFDFTDTLSISLEGRYQVNRESQSSIGASVVRFEDTTKAFSPRAILTYKPSRDITVYASYAEGTRPAEFNGLFFSQPEFVQNQIRQSVDIEGVVPEDKIRMGEIGFKGNLLDNRLRILAAVYYGIWSDRHVQNVVNVFLTPAAQAAGGPISGISLTGANGEVELKGIELEAAFQASERFLVEGTFNIADTKIRRTSSSDARDLLGNANPVGNRLAFYPKYSGTISATYTQPVGDLDMFLRADGIYVGRQFESEANLAYTPAALKVNLRLGATWDGKRIELFGTNIFDNDAPLSAARQPYVQYAPNGTTALFQGINVSLANRASYGIRASFDF